MRVRVAVGMVAAVAAGGAVLAGPMAGPAAASACPVHTWGSQPGAAISEPTDIEAGPDGNLWFTSTGNDRIGRITPTGTVTMFGAGVDAPEFIVAGPDGNLWYSGYGSDQIGRITPAGSVTTFSTATPGVNALGPRGITVGPDGNLWFAAFDNDRIGRITPTGTRTAFSLGSTLGGPIDIVSGPDGRLWFTAAFAQGVGQAFGRIGRITTAGSLEPANGFAYGGLDGPFGLTTGPDDHVWTTSLLNRRVLEINADGSPAGGPYTAPDLSGPQLIAPGPDGALWVSTFNLPGRLARVTTDGAIVTYSAGDADSTSGVVTGPDGNVWFTDLFGDLVGYVDPDDPGPPFQDVAAPNPFCREIEWMADEGISTGFSDRTYRPADAVTRQSMSAFMYRLAGEPPFDPPGTPTFPDVPASSPFFAEVEWMADEGITTGFADGRFRPGDVVTRQSMSAFMYRLAGEPPFTPPATPSFSDVPLSHPFVDEIEWMADEEITTGFPDGTFKPAGVVTRQAMSAFMFRLAPLLPA